MKCRFKSRQQRGITLIALVVTVVVLIILATVSISAVMGDNGIIQKAEQASDLHANSVKAEQEAMDNLLLEYEIAVGEKSPNGKPTPITVKSTNHTGTATEDTLGNPVYIPGGFKVHEDTGNTVDEGIVITDGTNEFVWVPVNETSFNAMFGTSNTELALCGSTNVTTNYYSNLRVRSGESSYIISTTPGTARVTVDGSSIEGVREPDFVVGSDGTSYDASASTTYYSQAGFTSTAEMAQAFVDDYINMRASIQKYDGFYIGRYELTGTVDNPTVRAGVVLRNKNWYELYKACRDVKGNDGYVTSTMIWGCQWDETINWLKNTKFKGNESAVDIDSSSWGNYSDVSVKASDGKTELKASGTSKGLETGITIYTMANKIYDLAGNYYDWTQEAFYEGLRTNRGGAANVSASYSPASDRLAFQPNEGTSLCGRVTLYVNP